MKTTIQKVKLVCFSLIIIIVVSFIYYYITNFYRGYAIIVNDKNIGIVMDKKDFYDAYNKMNEELNDKFQKIYIKDDIRLQKVRSNENSNYISKDKIKGLIMKNSNSEVKVYNMKCDGKNIGTVESIDKGKKVIESIKNIYEEASNIKSIRNFTIDNMIVMQPGVLKISSIGKNSDKDIAYKLAQSKELKTRFIANLEKKVVLEPSTIIKQTDTLEKGKRKLQAEGQKGLKYVNEEITVKNNKIINKETKSEKVIKPCYNKVVLVGNKQSNQLSTTMIALPSRGQISSLFGMRWGKMHKGIDIAAPMGSNIYAISNGTVEYAGWEKGYGKIIKLNHKNGIQSVYAHCSEILVAKGDSIKKNSLIGKVGSTGNSTGPHVHFEVRKNGVAFNPIEYLKYSK